MYGFQYSEILANFSAMLTFSLCVSPHHGGHGYEIECELLKEQKNIGAFPKAASPRCLTLLSEGAHGESPESLDLRRHR